MVCNKGVYRREKGLLEKLSEDEALRDEKERSPSVSGVNSKMIKFQRADVLVCGLRLEVLRLIN